MHYMCLWLYYGRSQGHISAEVDEKVKSKNLLKLTIPVTSLLIKTFHFHLIDIKLQCSLSLLLCCSNDLKMLFDWSLSCSFVLFEKCISGLLLLSTGGLHSRFTEGPLTFSPLGTRDMKVNAETSCCFCSFAVHLGGRRQRQQAGQLDRNVPEVYSFTFKSKAHRLWHLKGVPTEEMLLQHQI